MKSLFISTPKGYIYRYSWNGGEVDDYEVSEELMDISEFH